MKDQYEVDVLIVGAGQAGLAMGQALLEQGVESLLIVDEGEEIGQSWSQRYDSLKLFTPAQYSSLPGFKFPAKKDHYPAKDEVASYLRAYAEKFDLPVRLNAAVAKLDRYGGGFVAEGSDFTVHAHSVVVATGSQHTPRYPDFAALVSDRVVQFHSSGYQNPSHVPVGRVLIVGGGNSGAQIAEELMGEHEVHVSVEELPKYFPQRFAGKDVFWYLKRFGVLDVTIEERKGVDAAMPLIGTNLGKMIKRGRVHGLPRAIGTNGTGIILSDGSVIYPDAIIWATGFQYDVSWIELAGTHDNGVPVHDQGVSPVPGLYWIGLSWLRTKGSGFLGFVGRDTAYLAPHIVKDLQARVMG